MTTFSSPALRYATNYRVAHRAPTRTSDDQSAPLDQLAAAYPDLIANPDWYGDCDDETLTQVRLAQGHPEALVTIYRALPAEHAEINPGDWVTLSAAYAQAHAIIDDDPESDWPVIAAQVRAGDVFSDGNALSEFGYDGQQLVAVNMLAG